MDWRSYVYLKNEILNFQTFQYKESKPTTGHYFSQSPQDDQYMPTHQTEFSNTDLKIMMLDQAEQKDFYLSETITPSQSCSSLPYNVLTS